MIETDASLPWTFSRDVITARPSADSMVLVGGEGSKPVKLTGLSCELVLAIQRGGSRQEMMALLQAAHPRSQAHDQAMAIDQLVQRLARAGLLQHGGGHGAPAAAMPATPAPAGTGAPSRRRILLPNPDPVAHRLALALGRLPGPIRRSLGVALLLASAAASAVTLAGMHPVDLLASLSLLHWLVLPIGVMGWLALHELGHAVACRMHACPVTGAGLLFRGWVLPSPYVNTSAMQLFAGRAIRIDVPAAGPAVDLCIAGLLAATAHLASSAAVQASAQALLLLVLLGLYFNLTPFRQSDLTTLFGAFVAPGRPMPWQRGPALRSAGAWRSLDRLGRIYLLYCLLYAAIGAAVVVMLTSGIHSRVQAWLASGAPV